MVMAPSIPAAHNARAGALVPWPSGASLPHGSPLFALEDPRVTVAMDGQPSTTYSTARDTSLPPLKSQAPSFGRDSPRLTENS